MINTAPPALIYVVYKEIESEDRPRSVSDMESNSQPQNNYLFFYEGPSKRAAEKAARRHNAFISKTAK